MSNFSSPGSSTATGGWGWKRGSRRKRRGRRGRGEGGRRRQPEFGEELEIGRRRVLESWEEPGGC